MSDRTANLDSPAEVEKEQTSPIQVIIAEDKMSAMLNLSFAKSPDDCTVQDILDRLGEEGVTKGINKQKIKEALAACPTQKEYIVAMGKMMRDGDNGYFVYHFRTEMPTKPKLLNDGSVDYKNMDLFEQVTSGQLIAEYVPATGGEFGFTVVGDLLTPKRGKDLPPKRGKGFTVSEDRKQYFASTNGMIELVGDRISIENIYVVDKNVDVLTGNIRFDGDVQVRGDIATGFSVEATGNVVVEGHVEAADIYAGKSILIKKGSQGKGVGKLQADEAVSGLFFESVKIRAKQSITANYLFNCDTFTEDVVIAAGKRGVIIGGVTKANRGITCYNLGNGAEIPTYVYVGVMQEQLEEYQEMGKKITKVKSEVETFEDGFYKISLIRTKTEKIELMLKKVQQARNIKTNELDELKRQHEKLLLLINESKDSRVEVKGIVYPGVEVNVDAFRYKNTEAFRAVTFANVGNEVITIAGD